MESDSGFAGLVGYLGSKLGIPDQQDSPQNIPIFADNAPDIALKTMSSRLSISPRTQGRERASHSMTARLQKCASVETLDHRKNLWSSIGVDEIDGPFIAKQRMR